MMKPPRPPHAHALLAALLLAALPCPAAADVLRDLQEEAIATKDEARPRAYHFGSQGPGGVYSNSTGHTSRMIPVYAFGPKARLADVTGANSRYRTEEGVRSLYGRVPEYTVNPEAEYADQSDLYRVQRDAVERGARYLFTVWFDGMDWDTIRAAAIARTGEVYREGPGHGLIFQADRPGAPLQFGYVVNSPTRDDPREDQVDLDTQRITDLSDLPGGGYDPRMGGPNPWTPGDPRARGYLRGFSANQAERAGVAAAGGVLHAVTDSASSAAEYATGVKMYNGSINVADDGRLLETLFRHLQDKGWGVGTVTSVPFNHASPAAFYAHNVSRDDYQDLGREMLGLDSIIQQSGRGPRQPGLDVVIGCGWGVTARPENLRKQQGSNAVPGNPYITDADLHAIDARNGGRYEVAVRTAGRPGPSVLEEAAARAAESGRRLFGLFGTASGHLPFRTADGRFDPAKGIKGVAERYQPADLDENPTLAGMTRAALTVLSATPDRPFALFVESGDVDFALHDNNLDNAIGAVYSGEDAIRVIFDWIEKRNAWEDSVVIVTADHGHYLVLDQPEAIAGVAR